MPCFRSKQHIIVIDKEQRSIQCVSSVTNLLRIGDRHVSVFRLLEAAGYNASKRYGS